MRIAEFGIRIFSEIVEVVKDVETVESDEMVETVQVVDGERCTINYLTI